MLCSSSLLCSALRCSVYLICLILVCLSLFPPLCWFSSPSPWFGPGLSCPVQSSPPGSPLPSRRLVSFGLVFFSPNHLTSLPHLLSLSPSKQGLEGVCSTVQHRTQSILQARHLLTEFSHCVHLPLSASIRRAATFPESILVPEASFWRQQQYVSIRTSLLRPSPQPFELYIESCLARLVIESLRKPQRRTARFRGFRSTSAGLD